MTLKQIGCGIDVGNGWVKIVIEGKASKIPNWVTSHIPKGQLNNKTMIAAKPMAFSLEIDNRSQWFGQDTLTLSGRHEIDGNKYKPHYIRMMFKAVLWRWLDQHRIDPTWLADKRLNVVCGMPPEFYQDRTARGKAEKVYKLVFSAKKEDKNKGSLPDYINIPNKSAIPFYTAFGNEKQAGLRPETLVWRAVHEQEPGYTLLVDLGYGTNELCLLLFGKGLPVNTRSLEDGLFNSHYDSNPVSPWESELAVMRGESEIDFLEVYISMVKSKILHVARRLKAKNLKFARLVIFGGGANLLDQTMLKDLNGLVDVISTGKSNKYDEFSNARWFEALAKRGVEVDDE